MLRARSRWGAPASHDPEEDTADAEDTARGDLTRLNRSGDHPSRLGRLGDRGRRIRLGLGPAGRRGLDRRHPPRARARRQLDRRGGAVRLRAFGAGLRSASRIVERRWAMAITPEGAGTERSCSCEHRLARGPSGWRWTEATPVGRMLCAPSWNNTTTDGCACGRDRSWLEERAAQCCSRDRAGRMLTVQGRAFSWGERGWAGEALLGVTSPLFQGRGLGRVARRCGLPGRSR